MSVRVVGRTACDTCFDDHYVLQCEACGTTFDHYIGPPSMAIRCKCGADCTPTEEQDQRWEEWSFDEAAEPPAPEATR